MAITRSDLRTKITQKLYDWPINEDTLSMYLSAAVTTATVTNSAKFHEGDIIEIESEAIRVTDITTAGIFSLSRGYMGTTAAAHSNSTAITIINAFTTKEKNDAIQESFRALHPMISQPYLKDIHTYNNRYQIDSLDATTGWSALADATAVSLNTSDYKEGTGSLNLGATFSSGSAGYTKTDATAIDATNFEYLNLWINLSSKKDSTNTYNYNPSKFCEVRVGNDSAAYAYTTIGLDELNDGSWTLLNLNLQDFQLSGSWDRTTTDYRKITFYDNKTITSGNLKMDEWFFSTYPVTTNKLRYRLPKDMFRVNDVRIFQDTSSTTFFSDTRWDVVDNYLIFRIPVDTGRIDPFSDEFLNTFPTNSPIQLYGDVAVSVPSADTETITMDDRKEELVVLYATNYLFERLAGERTRFTRFTANLNRQDGGMLDVIRSTNMYRARYQELLRQFEDTGKPLEFDYGQ